MKNNKMENKYHIVEANEKEPYVLFLSMYYLQTLTPLY